MKNARIMGGTGAAALLAALALLAFNHTYFNASPAALQTVEASAAVPSVETQPPTPVLVGSIPTEEEVLTFEATAYCDFGITYSGVWVQRGIVAADPDILPIGSVIEVEAGDYSGIYTVMDTGGVVKGELIDIFIPDYEEAVQFGRQEVKVRVLRKGWHPDLIGGQGLTVAG